MPKISYMGNGSTTEFNFVFPFYETTDIVVTKNTTTLTSGYTVVGTPAGSDANIPYTGGKVVFATAPIATDSITISRSLPLTRIVDYQPTAKIDPSTLNQDMNYTMEVLKDFKTLVDDFSARYAELLDNESIQTISTKIDTVTDQITDFETEITNGRIMSRDDFYSYTTNCITSIPQDIKLELNNGTLTLKSGSKITAPNGTTKTTTSDQTGTLTTDGTYLVLAGRSDGALQLSGNTTLGQCGSGTTLPADGSTYKVFLNTTNGTIYRWSSDGWVTWAVALPLGIITVSSGAISSIDRVFNGFGFIGSTIFALPGVSGLIPNGRNADGTLKNTDFSIGSILFKNISGTVTAKTVVLKGNDIGPADAVYDSETNYNNYPAYCICGTVTTVSSQITSFDTKQVIAYTE